MQLTDFRLSYGARSVRFGLLVHPLALQFLSQVGGGSLELNHFLTGQHALVLEQAVALGIGVLQLVAQGADGDLQLGNFPPRSRYCMPDGLFGLGFGVFQRIAQRGHGPLEVADFRLGEGQIAFYAGIVRCRHDKLSRWTGQYSL